MLAILNIRMDIDDAGTFSEDSMQLQSLSMQWSPCLRLRTGSLVEDTRQNVARETQAQ